MTVIAIILALVVAFVLWRMTRSASGWSAGPLIGGSNYSAGTKVDATGSFEFPTAAPGVHYVTKPCRSLAGATAIRLRYRIEADPTITFIGCKDGLQVHSGPLLYLQREGDDWSGVGAFEAYRWWASFAPGQMTPGEHEITVPLDGNWTAVGTSSAISNSAAFKAALANIGRVGFTFPNAEGLGHGLYASGPAKFVVLAFDLIGARA